MINQGHVENLEVLHQEANPRVNLRVLVDSCRSIQRYRFFFFSDISFVFYSMYTQTSQMAFSIS